jgi:LysR family transcriptional regulator, glycine cleavage system transcriptional activator
MFRPPSTMSLLCLEASARLRSFTRAAAELHLSQGAVSRQIIGLEKRLNLKLFVRRRDTLVLTDVGSVYLEEVAPLLVRLQKATTAVMALGGGGGVLTVSVAASLGSHWLIPKLPSFNRTHSDITLNLATRVGPVKFDDTAVNASLEFGDGQRAGLRNEFVLPLLLSPYASPDWVALHTDAISDSMPATSLIHHSTVPQGWQEWFAVSGVARSFDQEGPSYELMSMALNAAIAGLGVVLLPEFMAREAENGGKLCRLSAIAWKAPKAYYLVYPQESASVRSLKVFRDWLILQGQEDEQITANPHLAFVHPI